MTLVWSIVAADKSQNLQQTEPPKTEKTAAPMATEQTQEGPKVKAVPPCGFCLEDGTKVPLILGRELSSGKQSTGNRVDFDDGSNNRNGNIVFPAAPVFLFMRGKDVVIGKGTPVVSYIDGNTELDATRFQGPAKPIEPAATSALETSKPAAESTTPPPANGTPATQPTKEQPPQAVTPPPLR